MNNINYFIHLLILFLLQIVIVDNIHLGSYFYLNIYILALYILPYKVKGIPLLQLTSTREEIDDTHGEQGLTDVRWFLKYTFVSTLLFNIILIFAEAFTFNDILISIIRIILSTFISMLFMLLYYFIGIKKVQQ